MLSRELLQDAALGYLEARHRTAAVAWQDAWNHATHTLKGAIQALEPVPPDHGIGVAGYRLTNYLDQHSRRHGRPHAPGRVLDPRSALTPTPTI